MNEPSQIVSYEPTDAMRAEAQMEAEQDLHLGFVRSRMQGFRNRPRTEPLDCPEAELIRIWAARVGYDLKVLRAVGDVLIDQLSTSKKVSPAWVNPRPWVRKRKGGAA